MKIAFFTTRQQLHSDASDSRYVYESLRPYFDITLFDRPDAGLCRESDIVFTRFPLPLNRPFLRGLTHYTDKLIINRPQTQLVHSKQHLLSFASITAPTIISADADVIHRFAHKYRTVVLKPLDRHKGMGVIKVDSTTLAGQQGRSFVTDYVKQFGTPVVQRYLSDVVEVGDKRINIIGYEAVSAVVTHPARGSFICHEAAGGTAHAAGITDRDRRIVDTVTPFLREHGVFWAAIDIIGPYLGEINVLTPAMVLRADRAHGSQDGANAIINALGRYQREKNET